MFRILQKTMLFQSIFEKKMVGIEAHIAKDTAHNMTLRYIKVSTTFRGLYSAFT